VLNRGVGGEEIADMLNRFETAVAAKPDLVLATRHQFSHPRSSVGGSWRCDPCRPRKIRATGADVVLSILNSLPR
jgi:hypothetical protein